MESLKIEEKSEENRSKCCTFCNKEGHKYKNCDDPNMQVLIKDVKNRVEICENRDDLYKFFDYWFNEKNIAYNGQSF